jgi:hypothetical protein
VSDAFGALYRFFAVTMVRMRVVSEARLSSDMLGYAPERTGTSLLRRGRRVAVGPGPKS